MSTTSTTPRRVTVRWRSGRNPADASDALVNGLAERFGLPVATLLGVEIWAESVQDLTADGPRVTVSHAMEDTFVVAVRAETWDQAREFATAPVLGVIAYMTGRLYLQCSLLHTTKHWEAVLLPHDPDPCGWGIDRAAVSGPHVLIDARHTPLNAIALSPDALWHSTAAVATLPLGAVAILNGDESGYVPPKMLRPYLAGRAGAPDRLWAAMICGEGSGRLLAAVDSAHRKHLDSLMSAASAVAVDIDTLRAWIADGDVQGLLGASPIQFPANAVAGVRTAQETALQVYGRYRPDASVVWTVEELGELAAAVRRGESPARLGEELGQAFNWILCLANIHDLDLAECSSRAMEHEARRQLACYGKLRPARAAEVAARNRS